jgi:asparagine synthase (glutamine-hydrolysing)
MCGIAGIIDLSLPEPKLRTRLAAMQSKLRHRGPDDAGLYFDVPHCIGLAHTRLSILDLSPAGHQPMTTDDGRYTIVFNGEIYNFLDLRDELVRNGARFHSRTDTEVILELYRRQGEKCVDALVGMFAFAIWDSVARKCFLARGSMGIKPLYVWRQGEAFAFASEVRALLSANLAPRRLCPRAARGFLLFGAMQDPLTLIEGIEAIPPGHTLTWEAGRTTQKRYYSIEFNREQSSNGDDASIAAGALEDSVRRHFVSDVPVSIFLSGGTDSTAILALARRCGFDNLRTYCISFDEAEFNEGDLAARTAKHFCTDHHDWRMTAEDGRALFTDFLAALDQPTNDGFNTYCVSKLAHNDGAKVVLSGLGGDELFGGYPSFRAIPSLMRWHRRLALADPMRVVGGKLAERLALPNRWQRAGTYLQSDGHVAAAYWAMRGIFTPDEADQIVAKYLGAACVGFADEPFGPEPPAFPSEEDGVSYLECTRYMQNQLLRDSDVMSMAWGLELRVPFVDQRLFDTVSRIPSANRLANGKRLVLDAVPEIPPWVAQARKRGFSFPFEQWIAGDWGKMFKAVDRSSPVRLGKWYRRWVLFTLDYCLRQYGLESNLTENASDSAIAQSRGAETAGSSNGTSTDRHA